MAVRNILFDFDNTLYKIVCDWHEMRDSTIKHFPDKDQDSTPRHVYENIDNWVLEKNSKERKQILKNIEEFEKKAIDDKSYWIEDNKFILKDLSEQYRIGIISNNTKVAILHALKKEGLEKIPEIIVDRSIAGRGKPAPDSILMAIKKMGIKKEDTIYVGDHFTDVEAAQAAGIRAVWITSNKKENEKKYGHKDIYYIERLEDIYQLLEELN